MICLDITRKYVYNLTSAVYCTEILIVNMPGLRRAHDGRLYYAFTVLDDNRKLIGVFAHSSIGCVGDDSGGLCADLRKRTSYGSFDNSPYTKVRVYIHE
jgi:hypothetical protein